MVKVIKIIVPLFLAIVMLISCTSSISTTAVSPTNATETSVPATGTATAQINVATAIPSATNPASLFTVVAPEPDEQVYVDPEGWYSVNIPADMKTIDRPNSFVGEDSFFETGYLPYMSKPLNLCIWVANIVAKPEDSAINPWPPCSVTTQSETGQNVSYVIYENPLADAEHRFIYIKMGRSYPRVDSYIKHTVSWLKTASEPGHALLSLEEAFFWENPDTTLSNASITEYVLPPEAQVGPTQEILFHFVPQEAQPDWEELLKKIPTPQEEPTVEEQLKSLGYELREVETQPNYRQQLLRDGRLLFDYVFNVPKVYKFSTDSGPITAFVVNTVETDYSGYFNSFLVVNDAIHAWDYSPSDTANFAPIVYQGELLWAKGTQDVDVEVRRNNREVLFTFSTYFGTHLAVDSFQSWNGHWILTAGDFMIQDGEILNTKLGFQEIFEWSVIDDKQVYLFRRGARLGLSYDGKVLLLPYDDIARGMCCGLSNNNPRTIDDTIYLFGKRDGVWYYAVVKFR
jgi:hypothetical protein